MKKKLKNALKKSPINYFSDLFVAAMVLCWIAVIIVMIAVGIYATTHLADTSMWSYTADLVSAPIAAGCGIWMVKNTVQHAIMNNKGKQVPEDFPAVDGSEEISGKEEPMVNTDTDDEDDGDDDSDAVG